MPFPRWSPHPSPPPLAAEGVDPAATLMTLPCLRGREGPGPEGWEGGSYFSFRPFFSAMPEAPSRRASSAATSAGETPVAAHSTNK
jgi:hypothetical protein